MDKETKEAYKEILTILKCMETGYYEKIPKKLIKFFERNSEEDYNVSISLEKPLEKQNLKPKTLALLAMIYLNYWCDSQEEKKELEKIFWENEKKYQQKLREKYDPEKIFDRNRKEIKIYNKEEIVRESIDESEVGLIESNKSFISKIISKIKSFFK